MTEFHVEPNVVYGRTSYRVVYGYVEVKAFADRAMAERYIQDIKRSIRV